MKNIIIIISLLSFASCDYWGSYTFKVKNLTNSTVVLKFNDTTTSNYGRDTANHPTVTIMKNEDKIIRIVPNPLNTRAHNCLQTHGMTYFRELIFDTYLDGKKVEKQIWQPDNWVYKKDSKYTATYSMTLTDELCQ